MPCRQAYLIVGDDLYIAPFHDTHTGVGGTQVNTDDGPERRVRGKGEGKNGQNGKNYVVGAHREGHVRKASLYSIYTY